MLVITGLSLWVCIGVGLPTAIDPGGSIFIAVVVVLGVTVLALWFVALRLWRRRGRLGRAATSEEADGRLVGCPVPSSPAAVMPLSLITPTGSRGHREPVSVSSPVAAESVGSRRSDSDAGSEGAVAVPTLLLQPVQRQLVPPVTRGGLDASPPLHARRLPPLGGAAVLPAVAVIVHPAPVGNSGSATEDRRRSQPALMPAELAEPVVAQPPVYS